MPTTDNPAGRLVQVIDDIDHIGLPDADPVRKVLEIFHYRRNGENGKAAIILAYLLQMTLDGKNLIESLDGIDQKRYLEPLTLVEEVLSNVSLNDDWISLRRHFDKKCSNLPSVRFRHAFDAGG